MYFYIKALHIIFVVTWFSGLFYMVRLLVYKREANEREEPARSILMQQFSIMQKRLWYGITWPSAVLTLLFGTWMGILYGSLPAWLLAKLIFVAALFIYHIATGRMYVQQQQNIFRYSSQQLRLWNEVATIFLIAIVMLAVVKQLLNAAWAIAGLLLFSVVLFIAIKIYKRLRKA
jgi:protoporphyrinogen IX oxidase